MKHIKIYTFSLIVAMLIFSCAKLDIAPTNDLSADKVFVDLNGYKQAFAKVYGAYALTGNQGPAGNGDIQGIDEGTSDFLRLLWCAQELSTDEAVVAWGDAGIQDFHNMNWSSNNPFLKGLYYRIFYQITLANDFINQASPANLAARGIAAADQTTIAGFVAEARFLRAYQYWVAMDLFGNVPFADENDAIGTFVPEQIPRADLFTFIESELKDLETKLPAPKTNEYGRADQAAAWALLARIYLNAKVYTGVERYSDAISYAKKVIAAPYSLIPNYRNLMVADNNTNTNEFILTINYDGKKTQSYGGSTFLIHAALGGSLSAASQGIDGGWFGTRTTKALYNLFPQADNIDFRKNFYTTGQTIDIANVTDFSNGVIVRKFTNLKADGTNGSDLTFTDTDFPLFRLSEMYLIYAEALVRGGSGGDVTTAVTYLNTMLTRAYNGTGGNISAATFASQDVALKFILDERARELYWEGFRRTDLIRYGLFTTNGYLWPWKGGVANGTAVESDRNLYPIPSNELASNPNLTQNKGY